MTDTPADDGWYRARGGDGRFLRAIDTIDRDRRAAELITQGWTYEQVTRELGYHDKGTCHRAVRLVRAEAAQYTGTSEDIRREQLAEIAEQRKRLWDQINNPAPLFDRVGRVCHDDEGNVIYDAQALQNAHALLLQLSKREGAIRGTDAPRRSVTLTGHVGPAELVAVWEAASPEDRAAALDMMIAKSRKEIAEHHDRRGNQVHADPGFGTVQGSIEP